MRLSLVKYSVFLSGAYAGQGSVRFRDDRTAGSLPEPEPALHAPYSPRDLQAVNSTKGLGTRSLYFIRVSGQDAVPHSFTLNQWIDGHFRTNGTSFKTVVEDCSFGKLKVVSNGGMDVTVDGLVQDYPSFPLWVTNATAKAEAILNRPLTSMADHIVFCSPVNATGLTAVGSFDGGRIHINSRYCKSLSLLMHEFGHNLGLLHSGRAGNEYADVTGMMGFSHIEGDFPAMCYNGYKHYQLRWFEDRHLNLADFSTPRRVLLAAFADYDKTTEGLHAVVVNVANLFFLQYNRAKRNNRETQLMSDLVTYTQNVPGRASNLDGGMGVGGTVIREHSNRTLFVSVCERVTAASSSEPDAMVLAIGYDRNWCGQV